LIQYRSVTATQPATQPPSHPASHVAVAITLNAKASSLKINVHRRNAPILMISDNVVQITTSFTNKAKQAEINANEMMMLSWRYTKLTFITGCTGVFWPAASGQRTVTVNSRRCNLTTRSNHTLSVYLMVQKTRPNVWTNLPDFSGKLQRRFYLEHNFYLLFNFTTQSDHLAKDNNPVFCCRIIK